jgi:hypothetical protein
MVRLKASVVLMSGLAAPVRAATPSPVRPKLLRVSAEILGAQNGNIESRASVDLAFRHRNHRVVAQHLVSRRGFELASKRIDHARHPGATHHLYFGSTGEWAFQEHHHQAELGG